MCIRLVQTEPSIKLVYLEYFPAHIPFLSDLGQFCFKSNALLPVHVCQTVGLLQLLLQYLFEKRIKKKTDTTMNSPKNCDLF